jgi:hypothetical protein
LLQLTGFTVKNRKSVHDVSPFSLHNFVSSTAKICRFNDFASSTGKLKQMGRDPPYDKLVEGRQVRFLLGNMKGNIKNGNRLKCHILLIFMRPIQRFRNRSFHLGLPFTFSRSFPEHLNVTTRRAGKMAASPVAGFRPFRAAFSFTQNFPKPDTRTSSAASRDDLMISGRVSVISTD